MIDLRSDTVTKPTKKMLEAMMHAEVGDDVYEDDPTVKQLETDAARLLGKDAALFVPSGTMGNQIAIMAHTKRGDEIILGKHAHIKTYEVGGAAVLSGVNFHVVDDHTGMLDVASLKAGIRGDDIHFPDTGLILSEVAHGSGRIGTVERLSTIGDVAKAHHIPHHIDGARLFNAALALNTEPKTLAATADSVMFCLSKGLASPVGSMLVGNHTFIKQARKYRKMLGGGMRQVGVLAAAGLISLHELRHRLHIDHDHARLFAKRLAQIDGFNVAHDQLNINMVFASTTHDVAALSAYLKTHDVLIGGPKKHLIRFAFHHGISTEDIDTVIKHIQSFVKEGARS